MKMSIKIRACQVFDLIIKNKSVRPLVLGKVHHVKTERSITHTGLCALGKTKEVAAKQLSRLLEGACPEMKQSGSTCKTRLIGNIRFSEVPPDLVFAKSEGKKK